MHDWTVVGLMSGTSLDGVDAAVIQTDGETARRTDQFHFRPYSEPERAVLRRALAAARTVADRSDRSGVLGEAEAVVNQAHVEAVAELLLATGIVSPEIDLIGFHGQTVFHDPSRRLTVQLGDGKALAGRFGIPTVFDFRAADVAAGGQGAPFVPAYHAALARASELPPPVVIVNIGGVANITRIGADGSLLAFDTGPGNALLDDFLRRRAGLPMDRDGALAASGRPDRRLVAAWMEHPYFRAPPPKSLDRDAFAVPEVVGLAVEDGAATLTAFTARSIARGIELAGGAGRVVVAGGGARNPTMMAMLAEAVPAEVRTAGELGWSADFMEAEAFAFLAARSRRGLPLSFPGTTGVARPMPGGVLAMPDVPS
jgi:anhydro-N-acetylmuramic acid kinase